MGFDTSVSRKNRTDREGRFNPAAFVLLLAFLFLPTATLAHDGPPFPVLVDQQVGPYKISVWGDPDVGDGTFFIIPTATAETPLPADLKFEIGVQPVSGRLNEVMYSTEREDLRNQVQYKAVVKFDAQEMWRVRVLMTGGQGSSETTFNVEATPPGYGKWDLLIYFVPFLAIGFLWVVAIIRKRRKAW